MKNTAFFERQIKNEKMEKKKSQKQYRFCLSKSVVFFILSFFHSQNYLVINLKSNLLYIYIMNEILNYNDYHDTTGDTECNDIINNEYKTNDCNLNEIQPAQLPQDEHLNEEVDMSEEADVKKTCICGSIISNKFLTNTRKYYDGDIPYFKIKSHWMKHTTTCNNHKIFKSIIKYIFYKRRYNKLKTCVKIINKLIRFKNEITREKNEKDKWVSVKGYTNPDFLDKLKRMTREVQMKIKNKDHEPYAPIRPHC